VNAGRSKSKMISRQSLRYKIHLAITLTLLAVAIIFGVALTVYEVQRRAAIVQQFEQSLRDLTAQYSEQLGNEIFAAHILAIEASIRDIMQRKDILAIAAYDESGMLLASSSETAAGDIQENELASLNSGPTSVRQEWDGRSVLTFTSAIVAYGEEVGFWRIHYSLVTMERQTLELVLLFVGLFLTLAIVIGLLLNSILVRSVLNPVRMLRDAMHRIQGTDARMGRESEKQVKSLRLEMMIEAFDELPAKLVRSHAAGDEIGSLAYSFQQMLHALKNAYIGGYTDPLTGLPNRRKLDEALQEEIDRVQRYGGTFSVILLDIDKFKRVNDTFGHLVGDEVLKTLSDILKNGLRKTDIAGRWGGEEFLILLPQQPRKSAVQLAEKLRKAIAASYFPVVGSITSSFGVAELSADELAAGLVEKADVTLYRAKELGRNRVEAY